MIHALPLATAAETIRRDLVLLHEWPTPVLVGVLVLALVILAMSVWNVRNARPLWRRILLIGHRFLLLLLLGFLFLEPSVREERVARNRNHVLVLVDNSRSMVISHGDRRRIALARDFVAEADAFWDTLAKASELSFHTFGASIEPFRREDARSVIHAEAPRTDLLAALASLGERFRDREIGAVLVLSDGIDNGALADRLGSDGLLDAETVALLESFEAPFFTYGVSGTGDLKDVSVESLRVGDFAFLLNQTAVGATIRVVGYEGEHRLRISLREDDRLVARQTHVTGAGETEIEVSFAVVPRTLGERVYAVSVEPLEGEVSTHNNARSAVVRVLRDRVRVLQIAGHPSWDVRFLRNLLKQNPNIDLISFFILVNTSNLFSVSSAETSLIPFPARELFVEELGGFDLVILQDFNYGPFSTRQHLHRVSEYVRQGGSLLMIGGRLAFSAGGYHGTAVTEVLPVRLPPDVRPERTISTEAFRPTLTEVGQRHPVAQIGADAEETRTLWENLAPLEGANLFDGLAPGGLALASHPTLSYRGQPRPVIAVGEAGEGRVMVFGSDASWFWSLHHAGEGGDPRVYDRFWSNAIRWLIRDPALDLVQVRSTAERVALGELLRTVAEVRQPDYRPAVGQPITIRVWRKSSGRPGDIERLVHSIDDARTDLDGRYVITYEPEETGIYEVVVRTELAGQRREGRDLLTVEEIDVEMAQLIPELPLLERIAEATGGAFAPLASPGPPPRVAPPSALEVTERRFHDLWTSPWLLIAAILLLTSEWSLRRRWGYL